ncbi:MAG: 4-(cytidine 5'-diphospho)-2-C-methyl-D-erythritol kinase [Geoalkalibacter sp.]|uniref:4-(cytidine 5'-diphospho)-2-C-methyl-D-erythritol kinase n=1 Tax=Geoalkalibacter sp. TaxID=3041440 RepID=UPI003D0AAB83
MEKVFLAPAKINLCLHVLGRRSDGYHELLMLMQPVSLTDRVTLTLLDKPVFEVECPGVQLAEGEQNIALRAARAVFERAGCDGGAKVRVDKHIPVAAGLGGGSSDAATVLTGLNRMLGLPLSTEVLMYEALKLGADVPFFVQGASSWARGVGERLDPVGRMPEVWYVLVNPGFAVSTAWVYGNLGLTTPGDVAKLPEFSGSTDDLLRFLHNDLERVTAARYPEVDRVKRALLGQGALGTLMSGSGPTVFGVFSEKDQAAAAYEGLRSVSEWSVFLVQPLQPPAV